MDRNLLLGLCATLNVAAAELAGDPALREAARHLNAAVVEIHGATKWRVEDLDTMASTQSWLVAAADDASS